MTIIIIIEYDSNDKKSLIATYWYFPCSLQDTDDGAPFLYEIIGSFSDVEEHFRIDSIANKGIIRYMKRVCERDKFFGVGVGSGVLTYWTVLSIEDIPKRGKS